MNVTPLFVARVNLDFISYNLPGKLTGCGCTWYRISLNSAWSIVFTFLQPVGLVRLGVFEEVHLTGTSSLKAVLERAY